ncbi:sulfotransferase family protein [mine drainage metagenome]|uniref:Sulfotransferase family protein n=1 Tax=mine drainage metagenome TaxID=410659 RepID=A0A1J5P6E9_9ZZZZ
MKRRSVESVSFVGLIKYKSIFIHIPKTAGISFNAALFGDYGASHMPLRRYQVIFSKKEFRDFFKTTIVRNPWSRLYSAYNFLKKGGINTYDKIFSEENIKPYRDFEAFVTDWLSEENIERGIHFQPQYKFICDHKGRILTDYIGYFENIEDDFNFIKHRLGINAELKKLNVVNDINDYRSHYTEAMKEKVARVYEKDIELFKYDF